MRDFVIDDPFGSVGQPIADKDMAAIRERVLDMPPIENQLAMNAVGSESGGQSDGIIHALTILSFTFEGGITGDPVVQWLAQREGAQHEAGKDTGNSYKKALRHRVFVERLIAFTVPYTEHTFERRAGGHLAQEEVHFWFCRDQN
jgi:hypothetical protein